MDYIGRYTGEEIDERLTLAGTAYQKPSGGIPMTDLNLALQNVINGKMDKAVSYSVESGEYLTFSSSRMHVALLIEHEDEELEPIFVTGDGYERFFISTINSWNLPISFVKSFVDEYSVLAIHNGLNEGDIPIIIRVLNLSNEDLPEIYINTEGGFDSEPEPADVRYLYAKPTEGIPASDMASGVQTSLSKANTALQPVPSATNGNLAGLNGLGKIVDSGKKPSDFAAANLVPAQASAENQLADKAFVNSSIQTETATFRGNWETYSDIPADKFELPGEEADNNDYLVVRNAGDYAKSYDTVVAEYEEDGEIPEGIVVADGTEHGQLVRYISVQSIDLGSSTPRPSADSSHDYWMPFTGDNPAFEGTWRFKYVPDGEGYERLSWHPEYQVNEKPLTAAQLAALNSGITDTKVAKLDALPATIPTEVFWATYGVTMFSEIVDAYNAGKLVLCQRVYGGNTYTFILTYTYGSPISIILFDASAEFKYLEFSVTSNAWSSINVKTPELTSQRVSSFQSTPDNSRYPSEKLVYDSLYKRGVISQTQTWTPAADGGYDYVMSDLVYGDIPRANIDLFESAGATFNETSGYFELNGLTDISYEEMQAAYQLGEMPYYLKNFFYSDNVVRTNILSKRQFYVDGANAIQGKTEIVAFSTDYPYIFIEGNNSSFLYGNGYIRKVIGIIDFAILNVNSNRYCRSLEEVRFAKINKNVLLNESSRLSVESILYMIQNEAATSAITITLHATAYARATADADITAALQNHPNVSLTSA